jgi:hypothetical protein
LRPTTLANVDALYAFAVSAEDARTLVHELDEAITLTDLINQDDFHCYAKMTLAGRRLPVFSLRLDPPPIGEPEVAAQLRARSRLRAARPLLTVEAALAQAAARYLPRHEMAAAASAARPHDAMAVSEFARGSTGQEATGAEGAPSAPTRSVQRGRFGRRPRAHSSPSARSSAAAFDLWSDLLDDPALPAAPDADTQALAQDGRGEELSP